MKKVELLPKGGFSLQVKKGDKPLRGRFSMYAIDRFCQAVGIADYFSLIEKIAVGMSLRDYATLLQCALNDYERAEDKYSVDEVLDLLDNLFDSIEDSGFVGLVHHAIGRITKLPPAAIATDEPESEEKKSNN